MRKTGPALRFSIELRHTAEGVEGEITMDGSSEPLTFSSWLELLGLLEAPAPKR